MPLLTQEEEVARILRMAEERGDFVRGDDGYWVYWPDGTNMGALSPWELRALADELDRLNAEWDKIVKKEIGGHGPSSGG